MYFQTIKLFYLNRRLQVFKLVPAISRDAVISIEEKGHNLLFAWQSVSCVFEL